MQVRTLKKALKNLNPDAHVFICVAEVKDSDSDYVRTTGVQPHNMTKFYVDEGKAVIRPDYMAFEGQNGVVIYTEKVTL